MALKVVVATVITLGVLAALSCAAFGFAAIWATDPGTSERLANTSAASGVTLFGLFLAGVFVGMWADTR